LRQEIPIANPEAVEGHENRRRADSRSDTMLVVDALERWN
jgi:hypothetical protein